MGIFSSLKHPLVLYPSAIVTSVCIGGFVKDLVQGQTFDRKIRADGKVFFHSFFYYYTTYFIIQVFIITGANCGIGKETAKDVARRGAVVYMGCRDLVKCEEARKEIILATKNRNVYCRELDLASFSSIKQFAKRFKSEQNRLDLLINNAGVMRIPKRQVTKEGFEEQIGVNHLGHFLLTHLLLDYLKACAPSRIINVSSIAHTRGSIDTSDFNSEKNYDPKKAYEQSKLANVLFTRELAKRLKDTGVTVNALHPGIG